MKRNTPIKLFLAFILVLLLTTSASAITEKVVNETNCNSVNNEGTGNNVWGQSFIFNATPGYIIKNIEFRMINHTAAPYPAGMTATLRLHWNETATNSTVLFSKVMSTLNLGAAVAAATCSSGLQFNASSTDLNWVLNDSGNYTFSVELQAEATAQFWSSGSSANPYANGKCYLCSGAAVAGFYSAYDNVFLVWAESVTPTTVLNISAFDAVTNASILIFNASVQNTTGTYWFTTTNGTIVTNLTSNQLVNVSLNASNYFTNSSTNYNTSSNMNANLTAWTAIYVRAIAGNTSLSNYTINYTNNTATYTLSTTTNVIYIPLYNGSWNVTVYDINHNGQNYSQDNATLNASFYLRNYTFYVYTTNSFNFTFRDEVTGAILYSTVLYGTDNIIVELLGDLVSYNYSANGTLYVDLLTPQDYVIRYQKTNFGRLRSYFITLTNQTTYNIDLYLLNNSLASDLTVTVYDRNTLNTIQGAIVYVQRYNVTCNCYLTVAMGETDVEGNTYFDIQQSAELYKFIVDYPWNTLRFTSEPLYVEVTQLNLYISLTGELLGGFFNSTGITGQIYYTNTTGGEFNIVYADSTASATQYCLTVKTWNQYDKTIVNVSCSSSPTGSFSLGGLTNPGTTYYGVFTAYIDGQNVTVRTIWEEIPSTSLGATQFGIFLSLGLFLVLVFLSQLHIMGLILGAFSLFISKAIGILPVSWGLCTVIFIASLIIALMLDKR